MSDKGSLYQLLLGREYADLPPTLQKIHSSIPKGEVRECYGISKVTIGRNILAKLLVRIMGLPREKERIPLKVCFQEVRDVEVWTRDFDGISFQSKQWKKDQFLYEQVSLMTLIFKVAYKDHQLCLDLQNLLFCKIPIYKIYPVKVIGREWEYEGKFHFLVRITAPFIGLIMEYQGYLKVDT